jgi:putative phosphoribosyl transferase
VLAGRLRAAAAWLETEPLTAPLPLGLFGASTGAAAALRLAADSSSGIAAAVSRGGRPDLAGNALGQVMALPFLIVGGEDGAVVELNRQALGALGGPKALEVIPGRPICSRSPGRWSRWPSRRRTGSCTISSCKSCRLRFRVVRPSA